MRKIFFFTLMIGLVQTINAQSKLGLKFSPLFSTSRTSLIDSVYDVESDGPGIKFALGLIFDYEITDTYYLSTGLIVLPKRLGVNVSSEDGQTLPDELNRFEEYKVNYIQVPVSLKLFTNEIQPDTRIFFQVGMAPEIKVFDEPVEEEYKLVEEFNLFDTSLLFGGGVEYRAGINTTIFGGITYQRGLMNQVKTLNYNFQEELAIRNTVVSLDFGLKF